MDPATTMDSTVLLNFIAVHFILRRWRSYIVLFFGTIKQSWPPIATPYSHVSPWILNTASKSHNLHRSKSSFSVATCAPGDPSLLLGSNDSMDGNTTYNGPYFVSVTNLLLMVKATLQLSSAL